MAPPKRALFSLNLDTDADHIHERIEDHSQPGPPRVKIVESTGPTHTHSDVQYVTKPFENIVNRTVNEAIESTGKTPRSGTGRISLSSTTTTAGKERRDPDSTLNVVSKPKRRAIERKYDTSEL